MTMSTSMDLLDLAEAVSARSTSMDDAEGRIAITLAEDRPAAVRKAVAELRVLVAGIEAVQAHAQATRSSVSAGALMTDADPRPTAVAAYEVADGSVRGRAASGDGRGGRMRLLVAATLLIGAGVVGASLVGGRLAPRPTPSDRAAGLVLPSAPTGVDPLGDARIRLLLSDGEAAWAFTMADTLYRTDDLGSTWTDMRTPFRPYVGGYTRPIDADDLVMSTYGPPFTIAATHDGGASWHQTTLADPSLKGRSILSFKTPDVGFATFVDGATVRVYRTIDGGDSWSAAADATTPDVEGTIRAVEPDTGVIWASRLDLGGQIVMGDRLAFSLDGGTTWKDRAYPVDAPDPRRVNAIWADDQGRVVLALGPSIFASDDDGRTWRLVRAFPVAQDTDALRSGRVRPLDHGHVVRLLSGTSWVVMATDASEAWSTEDGGATWRDVVGTSRFRLDQLSIASRDRALAIHRCEPSPRPDPVCNGRDVAEVLLSTSDGGHTWTIVNDGR